MTTPEDKCDCCDQLSREKARNESLTEDIERLQEELTMAEVHIREQLAQQLEQRVALAVRESKNGADPDEVTFSAHAIIEALRDPSNQRTLN